MKKINGLFLIAFFLSTTAQGQITKGNWMVGGNGSISFVNQDKDGMQVKANHIKLSPNVGYFFIGKFAGGIRSGLHYSKTKYASVSSATTEFGIGPFARYYLLDMTNRANLLVETSYQLVSNYGNNTKTEQHNTYAISAGPVIYFNTSVGMEFLMKYEKLKFHSEQQKTFSFGIGLQVHLEKDANQ